MNKKKDEQNELLEEKEKKRIIFQTKVYQMKKINLSQHSDIFVQREKVFLENFFDYIYSKDDAIQSFYIFKDKLDSNNFGKTQDELLSLLFIISKICKHRSNTNNFRSKIEKIFEYYNDDIKQTFSNEQLFIIFHKNKHILLYLLKNNLLTIDDSIVDFIDHEFFFPEVRSFLEKEEIQNIEAKLFEKDDILIFEKKRSIGENDTLICYYIREDLIDDFIPFISHRNISVNATIAPSIFETNNLLLKNEMKKYQIPLIMYSAFYGSMSIFNYLMNNNANMNSLLWHFAIQSGSANMIKAVEDADIKPPYDDYGLCLLESIKTFNPIFANYFDKISTINLQIILCYNSSITFNYVPRYDYYKLVNFYQHSKITNVKSNLIIFIEFFQ